MARINIEDSIHKDRRWADLLLAVKDLDRAYGLLVRTWIVAQQWYLSPTKMIPLPEWKKQKIDNAILESGWAEIVDGFVRVCGADEQFAWLMQRSDAGKKGGRPSKRALVESIEESSKRPLSSVKPPLTPVKPLTLPLSLSPPLSQDPSLKKKKEHGKNLTGGSKKQTPTAAVWDAYSEAYWLKYGVEATRNATVNAQLANFVARVGAEDAPEVARFYLTHHSAYYIAKQHSVGPMLSDAEALRTQWLRNRAVLPSEARTVEKSQQNVNVWDTAGELLKKQREAKEASERLTEEVNSGT